MLVKKFKLHFYIMNVIVFNLNHSANSFIVPFNKQELNYWGL